MSDDTIINKVAQSGIITLDLEELIPNKRKHELDIAPQLFQGLILREKDFREWTKQYEWSAYKEGYVCVYCSIDAVIPTWAYMLVAAALKDVTNDVFFCKPAELDALLAERSLNTINPNDYIDKRVVIKGCGERQISNHAYVLLTAKLTPVVKSLMFGEPCSTVPVYKNKA